MTITIIKTGWQNHQQSLKNLREEVFMHEQQISAADEWDGQDESAAHYLAFNQQQPIACARMIGYASYGKIGRMAVLSDFRRQQVATRLLQFIIADARHAGLASLTLDAQINIMSLYKKLGFSAHGDTFLDVGIIHQTMTLNL